jgi:S-DNA-T family DNA segregation ATPase FtsK/SpoIIIE
LVTRERKSKKKPGEEESGPPVISADALRGVAAVISFTIAIFLTLSGFGLAGAAGELFYSLLTKLMGVGYMLFPLSLFVLSVSLMRSFESRFGVVQVGSVFIFLLSGLALIDIALPGKSGLVGSLVSSPLLATVDTIASVIFLLAFIVTSLIIAFDVNLGALFASMRRSAEMPAPAEPVVTDNVSGPEDEDATILESTDAQPVERTETDAPPARKPAPIAQEEEAKGFPIITASDEAYVPPPIALLGKNKGKPEVGDVKGNMNLIKRTLQNFGIQVEMDEVSIGPTVTRYAMKPAEGVRLSKIVALQSNLELALAASPVRIEAPIPGKSLVGIEVPNISRTTLGLSPLFTDPKYAQGDKPLMLALGRSISGAAEFADLARMPHLLVSGTTGSGKSVCIHDFILSLLYRCGPDRLRFIMVDPKRVELTLYNSIPHLMTPVITEPKKTILALKWATKEMERRYNVLETEKVRDIASYHENVVKPALEKKKDDEKMPEAMPYIVIIIDELADIMQMYPRELEGSIVRLAQMSRAVGIHLVLATQRPSVKVITGLIKANVPARVAFQVASQIDSRTILDTGGAEKLLGAGDMLFLSGDMSKPRRIQAPYTSEREVKSVVEHLATQYAGTLGDMIEFGESKGEPGGMDPVFGSMEDDEGDDLYPEAKKAVLEADRASTSYLQRKLGVGYSRAAKLMDILYERGVIGPADGSKPREVIGAGNADTLAAESPDENSA